jgi:hypothetical protein
MNYFNWKTIHKEAWATKSAKINWRNWDQLKETLINWDEQRLKQAEEWLLQNPWCTRQQLTKLSALSELNREKHYSEKA